jgi:enoyl-CoA hydratase/carnithine racemase
VELIGNNPWEYGAVSYEHIIYHKKDRIAEIIINRPEIMNAMSFKTMDEFISALGDAAADDDVGVIVISGAGEKAFSSGDERGGTDMGSWYDWTPGEKFTNFRRGRYIYRLIESIRDLMKPVIAAVNGWALGGGFEIALACDIIVASEAANFGYPYVLIGTVSGTSLLPRIIGYHRACEYMFTGDLISAREAEKIGLVNHVVSQEELPTTVRELAQKLARQTTPLVGWTKWALNKAMGNYSEAIDYEVLACSLFHPSRYIPRLVDGQVRPYSSKNRYLER